MAESCTVLVIEDDDAVRELFALALEDAGYRVLVAADGRAGLEVLQREQPHLVLLDMRMPRFNGWEFAASYRAAPPPHAPIIVMTAGRDIATKAEDVGAVGHLSKPFDLDELLSVVAHHCEGSAV